MWGAEMRHRAKHLPLPPSRFNGAAPCGARKSGTLTSPTITIARLQRGRALWGAEIIAEAIDYGREWLLQRGRALWGAEILVAGLEIKCPTIELQRGRALWGAEMRHTGGPMLPLAFSFNGAAPCGARKCGGAG